MNLGGIYQLDKDIDASSRMGVTRKMMTQVSKVIAAVLMILILLLVLFGFLIPA